MGNQQSESTSCLSCVGPQEQSSIEWRKQLKQECEQLVDQCQWAVTILKQLKKIKKTPNHMYYQQLQAANQEYRCFQLQRNRRSSSYANTLNSVSVKPPEEVSIKKLLKQTDIIHETLYQQHHDANINHASGLSQLSKAPSLIFLEKLDIEKCSKAEPEKCEQFQRQLTYYIQFSELLKEQISKNDHQLNFVLNLFVASMIKQYNIDRCKQDLLQYLNDIQQFTRVFNICIEYYYDYQYLLSQVGHVGDLMNRDNMISQIVSLIFSKDLVYEIFYDIILENLKPQVEQLRQSILNLQSYTSAQFEISNKYALDESTHKYLLSHYPTARGNYIPSLPYSQSIKCLALISEKTSPQSKLKCIITCLSKMNKSITEFYAMHECQYNQMMDSDDMLAILMYIVVKSQQFDLAVNLYMIEQLATNKVIQGAMGYYLTTLQAAIKMILQIKY